MRPPPWATMCWTAHQVTFAAPVRLTRERRLPGLLPLLIRGAGDRVRDEDAQRCSPARPGRRAPRWPGPPSRAPPLGRPGRPAPPRARCRAARPAPRRPARPSGRSGLATRSPCPANASAMARPIPSPRRSPGLPARSIPMRCPGPRPSLPRSAPFSQPRRGWRRHAGRSPPQDVQRLSLARQMPDMGIATTPSTASDERVASLPHHQRCWTKTAIGRETPAEHEQGEDDEKPRHGRDAQPVRPVLLGATWALLTASGAKGMHSWAIDHRVLQEAIQLATALAAGAGWAGFSPGSCAGALAGRAAGTRWS